MKLSEPRIVEGRALCLAGLAQNFDETTRSQMSDLWRKFMPYIGRVPGQKDDVAYGVLTGNDGAGKVGYLAAVEIDKSAPVAPELIRFEVPSRRYAVFAHPGNVSEITDVWKAAWSGGLAKAGLKAAEGPSFERYGAKFDPATGSGGFEIWIPVAAWPA